MVLRVLSGFTYAIWRSVCLSLLGFLTCLGVGDGGGKLSQLSDGDRWAPFTRSALLQQASLGYLCGS